ncbi:hypothetical protein JTB14_002742 [Gonioctena quinquepunctata]|nr:hypothetical protein JTB14_002742 [Gonioctena quinquepunctata]
MHCFLSIAEEDEGYKCKRVHLTPKETIEERHDIGGGPEKDIVVTTVDNDINEIIGTQLTGRPSEFDDDTVAETIQITTSDSGLFEITNMDTDCDVPSEKKDELPNATPTSSKGQHKEGTWAKYTPAMLQAPKNKSLKNKEN